MQLYQAFLNADGEVRLAYGDTVSTKGGGVICLWNVITGATQYIYSQRHGFQCFTTNHRTQLVLAAEYCKNPKIHVYSKEDKEYSLSEGVGALQIVKMALSNDSRHLIIVNGIPEYAISVLDMDSRKVLRGKQSTIPLQANQGTVLLQVLFNPADSNEFLVLYNNQMSLFKIDMEYEMINQNLEQTYRVLETKTLHGEGFRGATWDMKGNFYLTSADKVYYVNRQSFNLEYFHATTQEDLRVLVLTQRHLILLYGSGLIEWTNRVEGDTMQEKDDTLRPFYVCYNSNISPQVKSAVYNQDMNRLVVGHENGFFTVMISQAERGLKQRQEDDQDVKQEDAEIQVQEQETKRLKLQVVRKGPFHTKTVTVIHQLSTVPVIVTAGTDGQIIFWNIQTKSVISHTRLDQQFVSGHMNSPQNILVLGTSRGVLMLFTFTEGGKMSLFYQANILPNQSLDHVKFNPDSSIVAVTSNNSNHVVFVHVPLKGNCSVMGYVQLPFEISCLVWNTSEKLLNTTSGPQLFVLTNSLIVGIVPPSPGPAGIMNRGNALKLDLQFYGRKIDPDQTLIQVLPSGDLLVTGKDKILRKYKQPEQFIGKIDLKSRTAPNPPLQQFDGHSLQSTCISISRKFNIVATGAEDGTIITRNGSALQPVSETICSQNLKHKGVSSVLTSNVGTFMVAGGYDGSLIIWAPENFSPKTGYAKKEKAVLPFKEIKSKGTELQSYQVIQENQYLKSIESEVVHKKRAQMDKLKTLKSQLKFLLEENEKHDELERLPRDQFVIDIPSRERILNLGKEKCLQIREESRKLNLKNQILSVKLKEQTWDQMEVQLRGINGLKANVLVYNYQVRNRTQKQLRTVRIVLDMRRSNLREQKERKTRGPPSQVDVQILKSKNVINSGYPTVLVLGDYQKPQQKKDEKSKKKKEEEEEKPKKEDPPQTGEEWGLLYSAFELFANNAKRNQIVMIKNLIFKIKDSFNKEFDSLLHLRQSSVDMIGDRNKRITEIYDQLKRDLDLVTCNQNVMQNPDSILSVKPSEVGFERYLSKDERDKLQKDKLKEEQRLRLLAQDDASQRALTKMMDGTLEQKKQSALDVVVEREKWMDKPLEEMNEDQRMKIKQYDVKKQKAQEEKQRTIKKLDAEIRKLRLEIDDILEKFDQKLLVLFKRKLEYDYRIQEQELYSQKLALSMQSVVEEQDKLQVLHQTYQQQQEQASKTQLHIEFLKDFAQEITKSKEAKRQALQARRGNELEIRIKNTEKNVFQEFYNSNPKQKRKIRDRWIDTEPELAKKIIRLDPYLGIESNSLWDAKSKQFSTFLDSIRTIQQNYEGNQQTLLSALETRFNLRKDQADLEKKLANTNTYIAQLEIKYQSMQGRCQETEAQIQRAMLFLVTSKSDIEVELRIKQGNVELQNQKPVPELSEAILLPREAIQNKNRAILQSAGQKIDVMKKIKTCKISVTEEELNLNNKEQLAQQLHNKIKSIQMLKVKKEMQTALVKKDIKMNQNQIKSIQEQIDNLHKEADKRVLVFDKKIEKINTDIHSIRRENEQLDVQKQSLEQTVKQRLKIEQMMNNQGSNGDEAKEKFEQISVNRKLFDMAKRQTEQIELLREELAKLKAKTFANFSNIQR